MSDLEKAARQALGVLKNAQKRAGEGGTKHQTALEEVAIWLLEDALQQAEPAAKPSNESMLQAGRFCDANCTAMDHHSDCVIGNPSY